MTDAGASTPVVDNSRDLGDNRGKIAGIELTGSSGKIRREKEDFSPSINSFEGMDELQDHKGINIH